MVYRTVLSAARGDPGLLSSVGRALGSVGRVASMLPGIGGIAGTALRAASAVAGAGGARRVPTMQLGGGAVPGTSAVPRPGAVGWLQRALPGGQTGFVGKSCLKRDGTMRRIRRDGKCYKRPTMNPLNPRAAHRAIKRIQAVRRIAQSIERALPHRAARGKKCRCRR